MRPHITIWGIKLTGCLDLYVQEVIGLNVNV